MWRKQQKQTTKHNKKKTHTDKTQTIKTIRKTKNKLRFIARLFLTLLVCVCECRARVYRYDSSSCLRSVAICAKRNTSRTFVRETKTDY